ncbi:HD-GYP domain-containing protein [Massilia sp. DWR3-1-1]|uniref:HD-GYP domain-containing protein n=1 Tax=Massilia sp. DWR3-1-1 TaxID=2804559 RepID=UPI003CF02032
MDINFEATILIAHGDPGAVAVLKEMLQARYHIKLAANGADALRLAALAPRPDLIVLDGALAAGATLRALRSDAGLHAPLLVLVERATEDAAWREGATDIIEQPVSGAALRARVALHLQLQRLRAGAAGAASTPADGADGGAILAMAALAEAHEPNIGKHLLRTQRLVAALAAQLQYHSRFRAVLTADNMALIVKATPLHDIGKATVDAAIVRNPGKLTDEQFVAMRGHTGGGRDALAAVELTLGGATPLLRYAREIAWSHHEKWDGSGYPQGLAGEAIPVAARLMAAADVYDALVTARAYRPAFTHETAIELIRQASGEHFDPDVADAVLVVEERFRAIAAELADAP